MKTIVANKKINCDHLLGAYLDESHYDVVINEDCRVFSQNYCYDMEEGENCDKRCEECAKGVDEKNILFVLKKGFFTEEEQIGALEGLKGAALPTQNRGIASGQIVGSERGRIWVTEKELKILRYFLYDSTDIVDDILDIDPIENILNSPDKEGITTRSFAWRSNKNIDVVEWARNLKNYPSEVRKKEAERVMSENMSNTNYANTVYSGIAGWFDRYPRIPYGRATSYTEKNYETFKKSFPFLKKLSSAFQTHLPNRYREQKKCIDKIDSNYYVPETVFTTITVNRTFRTAAHLDAGDLSRGFSNLSVLSNGVNYTGGYLVLPEYRTAINIRPGDLLLINNHECIHGNTEIRVEEGGERYSIVCYFREGMLELGTKDYEDCRYDYVQFSKKKSGDSRFNGTYEGMWKSQDWYDFCKERLGEDALLKYHPEASKEVKVLDFFD